MADAKHPMNPIAEQFKAAESQSDRSLPEPLHLPFDQIEAPAFFVDGDLAVKWVAPGGGHRFCQALGKALGRPPHDNIFRLLLEQEIRASLSDWPTFFSFVYTSLRRTTPTAVFAGQTEFMDAEDRPASADESLTILPGSRFQVDSRLLGNSAKGNASPLRVFSLSTFGGTLFLLRRDAWAPSPSRTVANQPDSSAISDQKRLLCSLSVRMDNAHRVADTMLPERYYRLASRIWQATDDEAAAFGARQNGSSSDQASYLFSSAGDSSPILNAIRCACRLNARLQELATKTSDSREGFEDIHLNMGISHELQDTVDGGTADSMDLMIPGGMQDQSNQLAAMAARDEIWITRAALTQLPRKTIDQIVWGVPANGNFARHRFTRVTDLASPHHPIVPQSDFQALAVACIQHIDP